MSFLEEFEQGTGTYVKVIRFHEPMNPDGFVILYLRPEGRFLMVGYWSGYERSSAVGSWSKRGSEIYLEGAGQVFTDAISADYGAVRPFSRILLMDDQHPTPTLAAKAELAGWSLLGCAGPLMYVGQRTVIDPDGAWLPHSLSAVDEWIARIDKPPYARSNPGHS